MSERQHRQVRRNGTGGQSAGGARGRGSAPDPQRHAPPGQPSGSASPAGQPPGSAPPPGQPPGSAPPAGVRRGQIPTGPGTCGAGADEVRVNAVGGGRQGGLDLPPGLSGPELVQAVIDAAKARRKNAPKPTRRAGGQGRRLRGYSGAGPDPRDPQPFGAIMAKMVKTRGWQRPAAEALIFGDWAKVVGVDVASHSRPVKLEDGELTVEAESTAWATQLRLLTGRLLAGIAAQAGHNVVKKLHNHGPTAPSWSKGPRRVRGRGPRDTYG